MKTLLVISFSEIKNDPRVYRQVQLLRERYQLTVIGLGNCPMSRIDWIAINAPARTLSDRLGYVALLVLRQFEKAYWGRAVHRVALGLLERRKFDLILANDLDALPLALQIADGAPVLLDAHEYAPLEYEDSFLWRLTVQPYKEYLCRNYLSRARGMLTVCDGLADEYARVYGVRPKLLMNAPVYQPLSPSRVEDGRVRLIHHGGAMPGRCLESMIEMMNFLDERFTLDFMLVPNDANYLAKLKQQAASHPRIRFLESVPMLEIGRTINNYDLGVYILKPNNFNNAHALPNKFFEFVQARLGIAIGPSPEMARLVDHYKLGVVAKDFSPQALAQRLNALTTADIIKFKEASNVAAHELCFEKNAEVLLGEVQRLIGK